jgi:hypothetical protein
MCGCFGQAVEDGVAGVDWAWRAQAWWQDRVLADHLLGVALSVVATGAGASFLVNASMAARKRVSMAGDGGATALVRLARVVAATPKGWAVLDADPWAGWSGSGKVFARWVSAQE